MFRIRNVQSGHLEFEVNMKGQLYDIIWLPLWSLSSSFSSSSTTTTTGTSSSKPLLLARRGEYIKNDSIQNLYKLSFDETLTPAFQIQQQVTLEGQDGLINAI